MADRKIMWARYGTGRPHFQNFLMPYAIKKVEKDYADKRVERSLYQRAVGYTYDAVKMFSTPNGIVEVPYREHVPPDVAACFIWLRNWRREEWREPYVIANSVTFKPPVNKKLSNKRRATKYSEIYPNIKIGEVAIPPYLEVHSAIAGRNIGGKHFHCGADESFRRVRAVSGLSHCDYYI
jgi:hypothetical protein